jgi:glutaredoxin domain-containing cysteine-rich protein 1
MDGLDDFDSDSEKPVSSIFDRPIAIPSKPSFTGYTGSDVSVKKLSDLFQSMKNAEIVSEKLSSSTKPLWQHLSEEALLSKMDPNVVYSYRRALSSRQLNSTHQPKGVRSLGSSPMSSSFSNSWCFLPGSEDRIVIYFTSLRGIRKTYEDCCSVRMIFRGFRVPVDERDISMDSEYRKELQTALGGKALSLPQVFVRGKYVGGAEEVKQLNEVGGLDKLLEGFPMVDPGFVCGSCGDARFVPCRNCNGSRKVFEEEEGELRRCPDCNENGLIRCPGCCCS